MGEMLKMAREMQGKMKHVKDELSKQIFEGKEHGIVVKVSGDMELKEVKIDPAEVDQQNVSRLEKRVAEAVKKAYSQAKKEAGQKMKSLTGGIGLPGFPGL